MTAARYTAAQRAVITREGHTLVEAGAGSGKTTTLVAKVLHALGAEPVPGVRCAAPCGLDAVAAVTFTEAAAADLAGALRRGLAAEARAAAAAGDPVGARRWGALAREVDAARIGTIHALCARLLREFAWRAGLDPAFRVLDEAEAGALAAECARAALHAAVAAGDAEALALGVEFGLGGAEALVAGALARGDALDRARAAWCDAAGRARVDRLRAAAEAVAAAGGATPPDAEGGESDGGEDAAAWNAAVDDDGARLGGCVVRLALEARARLDARLDAIGALDFDALVRRARDLVAGHADVRAAVRARLRWLFVDEFQDTDPAQRDLVYAVCGVREALAGAPDPAAPWLCLVGDPKQSLYAFRGADVAVWREAARDLAALGAPALPLDTNFRSRAPVLGLVDAACSALMPSPDDAAAPEHEVPFRALRPHRDYPGDDGCVVRLTPAAGEPPAPNAGERRRAEAARVAACVHALVDRRHPVAWDGAGAPRPARWGDVALLFRARSHLAAYEAALRARGVPCYVAGGAGFGEAREVLDLEALVRAAADERDDLAWLAVLRSPLVGLTDDALLRLRLAHPAWPLARAAREGALDGHAPADAAALAGARAWLAELAALGDRVGAGAWIARAVERSGYAAALLHAPGGERAVANVHKLVQLADARPGDSLAAFARHLADRRAAEAREAHAVLHSAGEDVVTLTTVHGAKGLEWPVVVLCDLAREVGTGHPPPAFLLDPALGFALRREGSRAYDHARRACLARERAEEKRVAYVAATRARDLLVLALPDAVDPAGADAAKPTAAAWLAGHARAEGGAWRYGPVGGPRWTLAEPPAPAGAADAAGGATAEGQPPADPAPPDPAALAALAGHPADPAARADVARRAAPVGGVAPFGRRSATELMAFERDPLDHRRRYVLGLRPPADPPGAPPNAPSDAPGGGPAATDARTLGTLLHAAMEADDADALDALAGHLPAADRERVRAMWGAAQAHPEVRRLLDAPAAEREVPFTWFAPGPDGAPAVVHGAMDLVARVGGPDGAGGAAYEVLDYKTNRVRPGAEADAAAGYATQQALYAAALAAVAGEPRAFTFYFPVTDAVVRAPLGAAAAEDARALVAARLRAAAASAAAGGGAA